MLGMAKRGVTSVLSLAEDNELITRCLDGDHDAFRELVERYQQRVYNLAFRMTNNHDDAQDLSQESFVRAYRALKSFKGDSSFSTWLHRITNNVVLDELRKRRRQPVVAMSTDASITTEEGMYTVEFSAPECDTPEEQMLRSEKKREIETALNELSPEHRLALVLRDIQGYSYEEIARQLDVNIGTVKSRINRARLALRERLMEREQSLGHERQRKQKGG